jgi:hypothetical protein
MMKRSTSDVSDEVVFGRDVTANATRPEDDHTLRVVFTVDRAAGAEKHDQAFRNFGVRLQGDTEDGRLRSVSYSATRDASLGADCLRYEVVREDRGVPTFPGSVFQLADRGLVCFHPTRSAVILLNWSERFLQGQTAAATTSEVDEFLGSLRFLGEPQPSPPPPISATVGPVFFSDRFAGTSRWTTTDNDYVRSQLGQDGYVVEFKRDDAGVFRTAVPGDLTTNVRVDLTVAAPSVRSPRANRFGIICSAELEKGFALYHMLVSPQGDYEIAKNISGTDKWTALATSVGWFPPVSGSGDPVVLQADCITKGHATSVVFRVNGETMLTAVDTDPLGVGRANHPGIYAQGGAGFRVTFKTIEIRQLN